MNSMLIIPPLFGMAGLLVALFIYFVVLKYAGGTDKVKKIADQLNIEPSKIIIVVDDMNLDLGEIRVRTKGGHGGHNGLRSIEYELGTNEYNRLRIGIGKPGSKNDHIDYVLGDFSKNEESIALKSIESAYLCILEIINNGFAKAMEKFNWLSQT